jgi:hypothetical protein
MPVRILDYVRLQSTQPQGILQQSIITETLTASIYTSTKQHHKEQPQNILNTNSHNPSDQNLNFLGNEKIKSSS